MPKPAGPSSTPFISRKNRALLAVALMALGTGKGLPTLQAQGDLATIRARAEQGDTEAQNALGNAYANGQGVPQNLAEAMRYYQRAAERGLAAAQFNLGMMHELGRGVAPDAATAFKHYLKAAEQGFAPAQFNVGNMYANGIGTRQDFFEAALWFRQAADRKVPEAQYNLALAYELGRGVAKDEAAAQRWYRDAAGQRYARAQYNLALMLEEGRGSAADPAAALELYRAAALQNFAPAQNNLGILLAEGRGSTPNLIEAYTWLALAVENGAKPVGRDIVAQQLSPVQLAEGNAAVAKLRPQLGLREPRPESTTKTAASALIAGARPPSGAAPAAPAVAGGPPPEVVALNTRVIAAETEVERLRAENQRLTAAASQQAARSPSTAGVPLQELGANDPRIAKLVADNAQLNDDVKRSTIELTRLGRELRLAREKGGAPATKPGQDQPAAGAASPEVAQQLAATQSELKRLREENEKLQLAATNAARLPQLEERVMRAEATAAESAKQRDALAADKTALEKKLAELAAKPSADPELPKLLRAQLGEALDDLAKARKANDELKAQVAAATGAMQAGEVERRELEQARASLTEAQSALKTAQQNEAAQRAAAEQLREQVASATTASAGRDEDRRELARLRTTLSETQEKLAAATREQATGAMAAQKLRDATEQLEVISAERDRLLQAQAAQGTLRQSLADAAKQRDAAVADKAAIEKQLAETKGIADRLEEANGRLAARFDEVAAERDRFAAAAQATAGERDGLARLNRELEAAKAATAELSAKNDSLIKDLEVAKQSAAAALAAQAAAAKAGPSEATKLELQTLQNQVRSLETQLEEDRKTSAREMATLAAQLQNSRESSRALSEANRSLLQAKGADDGAVKAELEQANTRLRTAQADLERLRGVAQERDALRGQVEEISGRAGLAERQIAQWRTHAETARGEAEKARTELAELQTKFGDTERAATQHGATVAELTGLNEKLGTEKSALEKQLAQARQAAESARTEATELRAKVGQSDRALQAQLAMLNEVSETNERGQTQVKELTAQVATLRAENSRLASAGEAAASVRTELEDMKGRLAEARKATEQHGTTVAELTAANEKLNGDLRGLQSQLESVRADNARLARSDAALRDAEQRAANLGTAATQLAAAQRDLQSARGEIARLSETVQALDRDRTARVAALQQENAAIAARLRQAQGTLDSIASAARLMNSGTAGAATGAVSSGATSALTAPAATPGIVPAPRLHTVVEGDSLTRISVRYYGTGNRWQDIYEANRETLKGENALRPGQRLRIP